MRTRLLEQLEQVAGRVRVLIGVCFIAAAAALALLPAPAPASNGDAHAARSKLTVGTAERAVGSKLLTDFAYGAKRGSLLAFCGNRGRFLVSCDVLFRDADGEFWCGHAGVRAYGERHRRLRVRLNVDTEGCELF